MDKHKKSNINYKQIIVTIVLILLAMVIENYFPELKGFVGDKFDNEVELHSYKLDEIPSYSGEMYVIINDNKPNFKEEDLSTEAFEKYSELDSLGRCGVAFANVCRDTMPSSEDDRGDISMIRPSGWRQKLYNEEALYNRCHLIAYQLSNENANERNLITGTRRFNAEGMLPFENKVADYLKKQQKDEDKHVLYRVTPIYEGQNLVVSGVQMEAYSVEDKGEGICFNVYVYNVQPGITINYATGESKLTRKNSN